MTEETVLPLSDSLIAISESAISSSSYEEIYALDFVDEQGNSTRMTGEHLLQQTIRMLFHNYGIPIEDITIEFPIRIKGRQKRLDIAIFDHDKPHVEPSLNRIVICHSEELISRNTIRIRDYDQAEKDLQELKALMIEIPTCKYGLWTNGLEFFYLAKCSTNSGFQLEPLSDWPLPDEVSIVIPDIASNIHIRQADPEMLRITLRRCQRYIQGNEAFPKDTTFWQLLYLIFCKIYDEGRPQSERRFWAGLKEQFDPGGYEKIKDRILPLFQEVKDSNRIVFRGNEEIVLSDRALAFVVSELARYDFGNSSLNAKEAAYQEIIRTHLRSDRGQYFTPEGVVRFMIDMLEPEKQESIFDPACGTGNFLIRTQVYITENLGRKNRIFSAKKASKAQGQLVFGADIDSFLVKAAQMQMALMGFRGDDLYQINSLAFPKGNTLEIERAKSNLRFGMFDVLLTNPPFGSLISVEDENIISQFELAHVWERQPNGDFIATELTHKNTSIEVLFLERSLQWMRPEGRLGIVLPTNILSSTGYEYIRWWILQRAWLLAIVDLPIETFSVGANIRSLTSLLFLKKKTNEEMSREVLQGRTEYPVFMAVAEKVGFDSRGNKLYKRTPEGEEIVEIQDGIERFQIGEKVVERKLRVAKKQLDDDLPTIANKYKEYLRQQIVNHNLPYAFGRG